MRYAEREDGFLVMAKWSHDARVQAIVYMALANALHFAGYEFARCGIMALFTSDRTGFTQSSMVTLATGLVSPFSLAVLWAHRRIFEQYGARRSLQYSTIVYALSVGSTGAVLQWCSHGVSSNGSEHSHHLKIISQCWIVYMFVAKSAFVQLLFSQHWSFLTSLLSFNNDVSQTARWAPIIAGVASIAATAAGWLVAPTVQWLKRQSSQVLVDEGSEDSVNESTDALTGLLFFSTIILLLACYCSDAAYVLAECNHFAPLEQTTDTEKATTDESGRNRESVLQESLRLFRRTPILGALCAEVLLYQSVATFLSHLFVSSTKAAIPVDQERATYTGKVYAWINGGSGVLQFGALPFFLGRMGHQTQKLWLVMPCFVVLSSLWMVWKINISGEGGSLVDVMTASFCLLKVLEYSLRGVLVEMVYGSLDYDSRFFGKEIVSLFANRLGRSGSAIILAMVSAFPTFFAKAPFILACVSSVWLFVCYRVVVFLPRGQEKIKVT